MCAGIQTNLAKSVMLKKPSKVICRKMSETTVVYLPENFWRRKILYLTQAKSNEIGAVVYKRNSVATAGLVIGRLKKSSEIYLRNEEK